MQSTQIQTVLNRITQHHQDVSATITLSTNESSIITTKNVPPFLARFHNVIKPHYLAKYTALGQTDGVLKNLADVIQQKIKNEKFAQNRKIYQTALDTLQKAETAENWPSLLHAGSNRIIHEISLRELLAFYWLAASDSEMTLNEITAAEVGDDAKKRAAILQASIENFIGLVAECRTAHNNAHELEDALHAPSCLPGTFGRIVLRASIYNQLTTASNALIDRIIPEIQNAIAEKFQALSDAEKTIAFRFISDKLISGSPSVTDEQKFHALIEQIKAQPIHHLLNTLADLLPGLSIEKQEVQENLVRLFHLLLHSLKLENDLPSQNFIDHIRKITFTPIAIATYYRLTIHDEEIVRIRLEIFSLGIKLNALESILNDEILKAMLIPGYLHKHSTEQIIARLNSLALENYAEQFSKAHAQLDALLKARDTLFENSNLEQEGITGKPPVKMQHELRHRSQLTNGALMKVRCKLDILNHAYQHKILSIDNSNERLALPLLPLSTDYKYLHKARTTDQRWAWNILRVICGIYPRLPIEDVYAPLEAWIKAMLDTLEPEEIYECLKTINFYIYDLSLSSHAKLDIITALTAVFKKYELTLNNLNETISFSDYIRHFNQLFHEAGDLHTWHQWTECDLVIPLSEELQYVPANTETTWISGLQLILSNTYTASEKIKKERVKAYIVMTVFKNLKLTEIKKMDAETLFWISQHYLNPETPSQFQVSIFTRDMQGFYKHLSFLLTTLTPLSDLFNAGLVRLMSAEQSVPTIAEHARQVELQGLPAIFRISNSFPYLLTVSSLTLKGFVKHVVLSKERLKVILGDGWEIATKPIHDSNQPIEVPIINAETIRILANLQILKPILSTYSITEATSQGYHAERTEGYLKVYDESIEPDNQYKRDANKQLATQHSVKQQLQDAIYTAERNNQHTLFQPGNATPITEAESATSSNFAAIAYNLLPSFDS